MAKNHVSKAFGIDDLRHGGAHRLVGCVKPSVNERWLLIVDQKLVEADRVLASSEQRR
jgi:hypothetical protein